MEIRYKLRAQNSPKISKIFEKNNAEKFSRQKNSSKIFEIFSTKSSSKHKDILNPKDQLKNIT